MRSLDMNSSALDIFIHQITSYQIIKNITVKVPHWTYNINKNEITDSEKGRDWFSVLLLSPGKTMQILEGSVNPRKLWEFHTLIKIRSIKIFIHAITHKCNCTCDYRYSFHTCIIIFYHIHSDGSLATFNQWLCKHSKI